jgi:AcrR family transcriptional regulator
MTPPTATSASIAPPAATREALMNAAEKLFAEFGVEGTSVRDITTAAGANLGAINYHFGSKDQLVMDVFARRLQPLNRERLDRLDALEKSAGKRKLKLESIIEALVRPVVEHREALSDDEHAFMQVICRCFHEPNPKLKAFVEQQFQEIASRFDAAVLRAIPGLPPGELYWRIQFVFGALHHGLEMWMRVEKLPRPNPNIRPIPLDREGFIQRITAFVSAGLAASAQKPAASAKRAAASAVRPA